MDGGMTNPLGMVGLLTFATLVLVMPGIQLASGPEPTAVATRPAGSLVKYVSSVDGWSLSYAEFLPAGFQSNGTYRLAIYLHGMMATGPRWVVGGVPSDFLPELIRDTPEGAVARAFVQNASNDGFILMILNTRTGAGFYTNTVCGGPQEQDVLDAVVHETSLRHVSAVYLIGFSMGSIGAFLLAAGHPRMFAGVAVGGTNTDRFAGSAWREYAAGLGAAWARESLIVSQQATCGVGAGQGNATTDAVFVRQSVARLDSQSLARTPIWVAAGGRDNRVPNNARTFPFMQVNDTFVTSTCLTYDSEPSNCTTPFWSLHIGAPKLYHFRYIYEPKAAHTTTQFDPADIFAWFLGKVGDGF